MEETKSKFTVQGLTAEMSPKDETQVVILLDKIPTGLHGFRRYWKVALKPDGELGGSFCCADVEAEVERLRAAGKSVMVYENKFDVGSTAEYAAA